MCGCNGKAAQKTAPAKLKNNNKTKTKANATTSASTASTSTIGGVDSTGFIVMIVLVSVAVVLLFSIWMYRRKHPPIIQSSSQNSSIFETSVGFKI